MAKTKYQGLTVVIGADMTPLNKAMREARAEGTVLRTHLGSLSQLLKFNPSSTDLIARKQQLLGQAIARSTAELSLMQKAHATYAARSAELTKFEQVEWRNVQRRMTQVQLEYERLKQDAIEFGAAAKTSTLAARGRYDSLQKSLSGVANKALAVSVATGLIGAASVKAAIDYEYAFADVRKTIIATEEEYAELSDGIREMALIKPISQEDLAKIMSLGGQLNIATQNLKMFTSVVADLDVATDMELEDASLQLARFANISGMAQSDIDRLGATIVDLGNNSATTESQIMLMAMRIAGSASNIGMSAPNVLALASALSAVGIQAEMGGNAISTIMNRIDKDIATSSDTLHVWAETAGMSAQEFSTLWKTDVTQALMAVVKGMGTFRDEGNNLNLLLKDMGISYMRQVDTMQRMSRTGNLMEELFTRSDTAWTQNTALVREATQRYETAESRIQLMKNSVNELGITIGNEILPYLKDFVDGGAALIQGFADMDEGAKSTILTIGGLVTVFGLGIKGMELYTGAARDLIGIYASMQTKLKFYVDKQKEAKAVEEGLASAAELRTAAQMASSAASVEEAAATTANTASKAVNTEASAANTAAETAETAATVAGAGADAAATASTFSLTTAKEALTIATGNLTTALGLQSAMQLGIVGLAFAGGIAACIALGNAINDNQAETNDLTEAGKRQYKQMQQSKAAYDEAVRTQGENSKAAIEAKAAYEAETEALKDASMTIEGYNNLVKEECEIVQEAITNGREASDQANKEAGAILNSVTLLETLAGTEGRTAEEKARLAAVTSDLNNKIEGLNLSYSSEKDAITGNVQAVRALAEEEANRIRGEQALENFNEYYEKSADITAQLKDLEADFNKAKEEHVELLYADANAQNSVNASSDATIEAYGSLNSQLQNLNGEMEKQIEVMVQSQNKPLAIKGALEAVAAGWYDDATAAKVYSEMFFGSEGVITATDLANQRIINQAIEAAEDAAAMDELSKSIDELQAANPILAEVLARSGISVTDLAKRMYDANLDAEDLSKGIEDLSSKTQDAFNKIEYAEDVSLESMVEAMRHNIDVTRQWGDSMDALWKRASSSIEREFVGYMKNLGPEYGKIIQALVDDTSGAWEELVSLYGEGGEAAVLATIQSMSGLSDVQIQELQESGALALSTAKEEGAKAGSGYMDGLSGAMSDQDGMAMLVEGVDYVADDLGQKLHDKGVEAGSQLSKGIGAAETDAVNAADTLSKVVADHMSNSANDAWWAGYNMSKGMANGIYGGEKDIVDAARYVTNRANEEARKAAGEASPSKVWRTIGKYMPEGAAIGIMNGMVLMVEAARAVVQSTNKVASEEITKGDSFSLKQLYKKDTTVPYAAIYAMNGARIPWVEPQDKYVQIEDKPMNGSTITQNFEIKTNNPEEVAALVAVRERRAFGG